MCISHEAQSSVPILRMCSLVQSVYSDEHVEGLMVTLVLELHSHSLQTIWGFYQGTRYSGFNFQSYVHNI
jgi:hypothetical protein